MYKEKDASIIIELAFISILFIGLCRIIDFRLGINSGFTYIYIAIEICIMLFLIKKIFSKGLNIYTNIKDIQIAWKIFITYMIIEMIYSRLVGVSFNNIVLAIKNLIFPILIFGSILYGVKYFKKIHFKRILKIINIIAVINLILVILGFKLGWSTMTNYVLGVSKYAFPIYKFGNSTTLVRVPGFFSNALTQGSFSFLVFLLNSIAFRRKKKKININMIFMIIGLIGIGLSTNRQVILGLIVVCYVYGVKKCKKIYVKLLFNIIFLIFLILGLGIVNQLTSGMFSIQSFWIRTSIWRSVLANMNLAEHPIRLFLGTGVDATTLGKYGFGIQLVDNSYLLMIHDYGIIGVGMFIFLLRKIYVFLKKSYYEYDIAKVGYYYLIYFLVRMFFQSAIINTYESNIFFLLEAIVIIYVVKNTVWSEAKSENG